MTSTNRKLSMTMLSKAKIKYILSLTKKKQRDEEHAFIAEGAKIVGDIAPYFKCKLLCGTSSYLKNHPELIANEIIEITETELKQVSQLKTPRDVIAVFHQHPNNVIEFGKTPTTELCLALDEVQDPGNLGTIIRIADWFGIHHIYCSTTTADVYAPKVIQATMGAIARIHLHYVDLEQFLKSLPETTPIMGTFLDGDNIYTSQLPNHGIIIMGNEGNGISDAIKKLVNYKFLIPSYPANMPTSESLNVAVATAITCAEFRRRMTLS